MELMNLAAEQRLLIYNTLLGDPDIGARIGSWEWDVQTHQCVWSDTTCAILGLPPRTKMESAEIVFGMIHPEDVSYFHEMNQRAAQTGEAPPIEYRIVRPDGQVRHLRARGQALKDADGTVLRMIGTLTDITHQKEPTTEPPKPDAWSTLDHILHRIELVEPVRGGGGFLIFTQVQIQLSLLQFEFLQLLVKRQRSEADEPETVRGFIPSVELLADLPWETSTPINANLKQVIRKTRTLLRGSGLKIESVRGHGYRLWVDKSDA